MSNVQTTKPTLAYVALGVGVLGIIAGFLVPLIAWVLGVAGIVTGFVAQRTPAMRRLGQIGMAVSFLAILVGVYEFSVIVSS